MKARVPVRDRVVDGVVIPRVEEEIALGVAVTERERVRVHKTVDEEEVAVDAPCAHEELDVVRVPIDRQVDVAPAVRTEGETTIIPVVEEVVVFEKRLVLKEEIRITKRRVEETRPVRATRRREHVAITREALTGTKPHDRKG